MFCPECRDEYRPGFTRCATCDAALVASLDARKPETPSPVLAGAAPEGTLAAFCGFLTIEEARQARNKLRGAKLPADILIREEPGATSVSTLKEEFWLRVRPTDFAVVEGLIGFEPAAAAGGDDTFGCSACGVTVHASDEECPGCGLRFE